MNSRIASRAVSGRFARLRFAKHIGKKPAANGDAGLHSASHDDSRALAGYAKATAPDPQAAGSVINLESALIHGTKRGDNLTGNSHVFRHEAGWIVVNCGNFGGRTAGQEN